MAEHIPQLEDIFADLAINELYELHMSRGTAEGMSEEEAAIAAQSLHTSDPDGFRQNALLLMQAGVETQEGWIARDGISEAEALERWELIRDCEPLVVVGFVRAFYALKANRPTDQ